MTDILSVSKAIKDKITLLESCRGTIRENGNKKAKAISDYDKALAITLIKLKNGEELMIEDIAIKDPPASTSEKIAKGACWQERLAMETADALYKANLSSMESLKAELNGWQSIFRYLEETE